MPRRIRITVAYDGTDYHGWQVQPDQQTIQGVLEGIVSGIEGGPVHVAGSGRTDAGVHAEAQVAAFTLSNPIPVDNLRRAVNRLLPPAIRVLNAEEAPMDFHPRFDAIAKTYRYTIARMRDCPPVEWRYVHHHPWPLDEERMITAARVFEGEHDFAVFAAADETDRVGRSKVRRIFHSELTRGDGRLILTIRGNGFLKHMVRNLAGTLIEVGRGNIDGSRLPEKCGPTAPARGLTLVGVEYPPR
ncbi:MAG: tRNA pseudouridine(38-40) synthase TruA [Terriglobia bacterium]